MTRPRGPVPLWEIEGELWSTPGTVERVHDAGGWFVPHKVWAEADTVYWRGTDDWPPRLGSFVATGKPSLERFMGLESASASRIASFARKWGVMLMGQQGVPVRRRGNDSADPFLQSATTRVAIADFELLTDDHRLYMEPAVHWRTLAKRARCVLNLATRLRQERPGTREDWEGAVVYGVSEEDVEQLGSTACARITSSLPSITDCPMDVQRALLIGLLEDWIDRGAVLPSMTWVRSGPEFGVKSFTLFGAIGLQLSLAVGKLDGYATCCGCGTAYAPSRKPRADQRRYCGDCREEGIPQRHAAQQYRLRRKRPDDRS